MHVLVETGGVVVTEGLKVISSRQNDDVLLRRVIGFVTFMAHGGADATQEELGVNMALSERFLRWNAEVERW